MPTSIAELTADWQRHYVTYLDQFGSGQRSFVPNLLPQTAVQFSVYQTLDVLHKRLGHERLRRALDPHETIDSPAQGRPNGAWLGQSNMVGVNVRTIGSFWNVVNYALTLPAAHDSIHLLPIWEPGVVGSLYGMVSWQINPEFYDVNLARFIPALDTIEKQLKVVVNLLHALGRTVGMDVIPHTDRFSEMALVYPALFEWVHRDGPRIVDHTESVFRAVEEVIWQFMRHHGPADGGPIYVSKSAFFDPDSPLLTDEQRHRALFGSPHDYGGRLSRRLALIRQLTAQGFETLPMTMGPPYRGLHIDPAQYVVDEFGQTWYQYVFDEPQAFSRVFGPLARYKFYHSHDDNRHWQLDFDRPNRPTWAYLGRQVHACRQAYNFDFMRGDMAHVQMRPAGVPPQPDAYYDPLRAIKHYVAAQGAPHYGFFAETFLAPPGEMAYGNEPDHLDAIDADSTLGDLQSTVVGSRLFAERFAQYYDWLKTRRFAPNFTVMTADKDDPRFDAFYRTGNVFRYFTALFLTDMPSYVGLGFEVRNPHLTRGKNEEYTKLYVFRITDETEVDKVTHGPFAWGQNAEQFAAIGRIRLMAEQLWPDVVGRETRWLVPPGVATPGRSDASHYVAWTHTPAPKYVFVASMAGALPARLPELPAGEVIFDEPECRIILLT